MKKKEYVNLPKGDTVPINPQIEKQVLKSREPEVKSRESGVRGREPKVGKTEPAVMAEMKIRRKKK